MLTKYFGNHGFLIHLRLINSRYLQDQNLNAVLTELVENQVGDYLTLDFYHRKTLFRAKNVCPNRTRWLKRAIHLLILDTYTLKLAFFRSTHPVNYASCYCLGSLHIHSKIKTQSGTDTFALQEENIYV